MTVNIAHIIQEGTWLPTTSTGGLHTPAESPDLNPIENVWGSMKEFLRNAYKPRGLEELKSGIKEFWMKLTPEVCTKYINHLQTVIPIVIEKHGGPSGY